MDGPCKARLFLGQDLRAHPVGSPDTAWRRDIVKGGLSLAFRLKSKRGMVELSKVRRRHG